MRELLGRLAIRLRHGGPQPHADAGPRLRAMARLSGPRRAAFLRGAADTLDLSDYAALQARYIRPDSGIGYMRKYLDLAYYLNVTYSLVHRLGLDTSAPLRILDLGCGPGHFLYVCKQFGHTGHGLDLPGMPFLDDMTRFFGVTKSDVRIRPREPLPDLGKFDLAIGLSVAFHRKTARERFDLDDWSYFFNDLRSKQLSPGGRVYLWINPAASAGGLSIFDRRFAELANAFGGTFRPGTRVLKIG